MSAPGVSADSRGTPPTSSKQAAGRFDEILIAPPLERWRLCCPGKGHVTRKLVNLCIYGSHRLLQKGTDHIENASAITTIESLGKKILCGLDVLLRTEIV